MSIPKFEGFEFERLYAKLLTQKTKAFFCLFAKAGPIQSEIAERMSGRFPDGEVQIIDFNNVESDYVFSESTLSKRINKGAKIVFLANFQLSCGNLSSAEFFQALNSSRDGLAELPYVFVFMTPQYFSLEIARNAPNFNSSFQFHIDFTLMEESPGFDRVPDTLSDGYSETCKELLTNNLNEYSGLDDHESKRAFEVVLNILDLNASVHSVYFVEIKSYYEAFKKLLPRFQNEFEGSALRIANVCNSQGDSLKALSWYEKALSVSERMLENEPPDTDRIYNDIADVYEKQGNYVKALEWYQKALDIREKALGMEHLNTAATYSSIARVCNKKGDYEKALSWYEKALSIREKVLGKVHLNTAGTYNGIAMVYHKQRDYTKAILWYDKVLAAMDGVLGNYHPDTASTYNNIALIYDNQGDYAKALEWYEKALFIRSKLMGLNAPVTSRVYCDIALVYEKKGDHEKALELFEKALVIFEKALGKEHLDTVSTYNNIAIVYDKQGDDAKALEWRQKVTAVLR